MFGLDSAPANARVVLLPVPWEATTSYGRGTARGPEAIQRASQQIDLFDLDTGDPYEHGIAMLLPSGELVDAAARAAECALRVIAAGDRADASDIDAVNELSAWLDEHVATQAQRWLADDKLVGTVGGDHSVAFGAIRAHAQAFDCLGVLQFDAHADLRVAYQGFVGSHASVMHRVMSATTVSKLVSVGVRDLGKGEYEAIRADDRIEAFFDTDIAQRLETGEPFAQIASEIAEALPRNVYVSFDIDGLDPSLCPNTGTPVPGGLSLHQANAVLRAVVASGRRIVGFDLCEVAPGLDEWDANVGARVLYKLIGFALNSGAGAKT